MHSQMNKLVIFTLLIKCELGYKIKGCLMLSQAVIY